MKNTSGRFGKKPTNSALRATATTLAVTLSCSAFGLMAAATPAQASVYGERLVTTIGSWGATPGFGPENSNGQVRAGRDQPNALFEIPAIDKTGPITYSDAHRSRTYCLAADQTAVGVELTWAEVGTRKCENVKTVRRGKLNQFGFVGAVGSNWGKKLGVLPGSDGIGWTGNQQYFNIEAVSDPKTVTIQGPVSTSLSQKPEIFGRGTIRATIQVWNSTTGVLLGTTTVRDDGYWFLDAGTVFQSGQTVEITAKQVARYSVKASEAHATFTVSQPVTIRLRSISTQKQQAVVFGTATPNAKVHVRADSTGEEAFILADAQGKWRDHTFTGLPSGKTTFTVVQYIDTVRPVQGGSASIGFSIEVPAVAEKPVTPVVPEKPVEPVTPVEPEKPVDPVDPVVPDSSVVETFDHDPGDITTETSEEDESSVEAVTDDAVEQLPLGPSAKAVEEARLEEARLAALAELEEKRLAAAREAEAKLAAERRELEQKQRELEKLQRELAEKKPETELDQPAESETKQDVEIGSHAAIQPEPDASPETEDSKAATGVTADVSAEADRLEEAKRVLEAEKRALEERAAAEAAQQEEGEQPHDIAQAVAEIDVVAEAELVAETLPAAENAEAAEPVPAEPVPAQVPANDVAEAVPGVDKPVYSPDNTTLPAVGRVELTAPLEQAGGRVTINVQPARAQNVAPAPQPVTTLVRAQAEAAPVAAVHTRESARSVALPIAASAPTAPKPAAVPMKSVVADKSAAIASVRESESVNMGGIYVLGFGVLAAAGAAACSREVLRRRNTAVNQDDVSAA
ncbi:hypothetical protein ICL81_01490 [Leucobacter sp. cx-328]|uniref:hypothetical protein n=1 Tax=unclassified Leucobacter TaxID=2621730 RepID=UPI00165E7950|nr:MULTISPECIES: hypothetical protein [unclassified Leucobacter]MBC9943203.1 hypothetical protein [Leucobacter sp. cx-328]